ncbi:hypothetical protein [Shouchella lonarensis]|uniref:Uncharacterized protein n=1 Tax=Shouchella lonarensis TaxID=1464122 RepID=A0A1G6NZX3_9BACI|nr:hypothetical protein [Shouchella lonarensis]SDC73288.1 hypothetical protein SAMN05421737_11427 [Shouchella lonarensis]
MKKLIASYVMLLGGIVYLLYQFTRSELYLPHMSVHGDNPISFHWRYVGIDTGFSRDGSTCESMSESIHYFPLSPFYLMVFISLVLFIMFLVKRRKDRSLK